MRIACLASTPVHVPSPDFLPSVSPGVTPVKYGSCHLITELETSEVESLSFQVKCQRRCQKVNASRASPVKQRVTKNPTTPPCGDTNGCPTKCHRGRKKMKTQKLKASIAVQSPEHIRPRFELRQPDSSEQAESLLSSDLSIELSHQREQPPSLFLENEEESDEEEDEELPSFLMQAEIKLPPIVEGAFVWHKMRQYPYWPALVKTVYRKQKRASIVFIDYPVFEKKGFSVPLKSLKPFDCEEASGFIDEAKHQFNAAISWALDLIADYRIRIACGSFSGSFIKYFAHDMSYPVRRMYPQEASKRLNIASDAIILESHKNLEEDSSDEQEENVGRGSKRLLPDRAHAAHNRANEKLVHFIVKQRMVESHLLAVICGEEQSKWLRSFLTSNRRRVVNIYLEDDQQVDQVYCYLSGLYATAVATTSCLAEVKSTDCVSFVLDVLLPEAIIYAIAGVDNLSVEKAEEKYLKGRRPSKRERQEFDLMIEKHMKIKTWNHNTMSSFS